VGTLGYAFMGKAHSNAFRKLGYIMWPPPLRPRLVAIAGRDEQAVAEAAKRYGFDRWTTRWEELVADPEIGLLDNLGPNDVHAAPTRSSRGARSTTPSRRRSSSRTAPSAPSTRLDSHSAGVTRASGRSTAPTDLSSSTWSASTSCTSSAPTATGHGLQENARHRARSPVRAALVAAGPHRRPGRHVRPRVAPLPGRDRRRRRRRTARATFEDGYRAAEVCDAVVRSSESGKREAVTDRTS
jgi:predicted dehydrogenase